MFKYHPVPNTTQSLKLYPKSTASVPSFLCPLPVHWGLHRSLLCPEISALRTIQLSEQLISYATHLHTISTDFSLPELLSSFKRFSANQLGPCFENKKGGKKATPGLCAYTTSATLTTLKAVYLKYLKQFSPLSPTFETWWYPECV